MGTSIILGAQVNRNVTSLEELTLDKIQITEGALYPTLHALESDGLVTTETEFIGKRVRKYYSLSPSGKNKTKEKNSF